MLHVSGFEHCPDTPDEGLAEAPWQRTVWARLNGATGVFSCSIRGFATVIRLLDAAKAAQEPFQTGAGGGGGGGGGLEWGRNGMEWKGSGSGMDLEWNGMEWNGRMEWMEWNGMDQMDGLAGLVMIVTEVVVPALSRTGVRGHAWLNRRSIPVDSRRTTKKTWHEFPLATASTG